MNNHNAHNSKMMWWMIIGCLVLPIGFIAVSSGFGGFTLDSNWPWLIFVLLFIGLHVGMLFHGHGSETNDEHSHGDMGQNKKGN